MLDQDSDKSLDRSKCYTVDHDRTVFLTICSCVFKVKSERKLEIKLEDVRAVLAEKSRAGHTAEVRTLLQKYGAAKLSAVDPANYEALLKDAEVIGNGS